MSKEREYKIKKLEKSIEKKRAAYNKLSRGGIAKRTETKIKALTNKELYVKFERKKVLVNGRKDIYNINAPTKYKTLPSIRVRDRKHTGHGILNTAVRHLDRIDGDIPGIEKKLQYSQPKTRRGKFAKTVLLASTKTLKHSGKIALDTSLAIENAAVTGTAKAAKKVAAATSQAAKNKLKNKAEETLEPYSVYIKTAGALPTAKEIKQYIKQKKSYRLENAKAKLLKAESKMSRLETKKAKKELRQAKRKYREKTSAVSYLNGNANNILYSRSHIEKTEKLTAAKQELRSLKKELRQSKQSARKMSKSHLEKFEKTSQAAKNKKAEVRKLKYDRKANVKQKKVEAHLSILEKKAEYRHKLSSSHGVLAGKKREYALQRRTAKYEKPKSLASEKARLLGSQVFSNITNADDDNTTLVALGKAVQAGSSAASVTAGAYKLLNKTSIKAEGKLREAARKTSQNKLRKKTQKIKARKKQAAAAINDHVIKPKKMFREKAAEVIKGLGSAAAGAAGKFVAFCFPIVLMLMMIVMVLYCLANAFAGMVNSAGAWTLGTYQADDFDLSNAETAYTKQADELNKKIVELSSALAGDSENDWKNILTDYFGAEKRKLRKKPTETYWGRSTRFDWDPVYDFDREKLWSFLCAYYTKIDPATGICSFTNWDYTDSTEALIDELFKMEYEFVYHYEEEVTEWKELSKEERSIYGYWDKWHVNSVNSMYSLYPERFVSGPYMNLFSCVDSSIAYNVSGDAKWRFKFKISGSIDSPGNGTVGASHLSDYVDEDNYIYVSSSDLDYRILNPYNEFAPTEYCLRNTVSDKTYNPGSTKVIFQDPFYLSSSSNHPGIVGFYGDYYKDYSRGDDYYIESKRFSTPFDVPDMDEYVNFFIPSDDVFRFSSGKYKMAVFSYYEGYYPLSYYSRIYYNVKQFDTFDNILRNKLMSEPNGAERIALYEMYLGISEDSPAIHGGHQIFHTILPGKTFYDDYVATGKIATGFGYDMYKWNKITHINQEGDNDEKHNGIDVYAEKNTRIYAVFSGVIKKVDYEQHAIFLETDSFIYHYEKGDKDNAADINGRATSARYYNVIPVGTLAEGSRVKEGDVIGYTTGDIWCKGKDNSKYVGDPYLHFEVYIDKDGIGWDYVDPIPLLGDKKSTIP